MTKFEEEFKALTSWDWINIDLIQRILTRFGNWHSDEEFQTKENELKRARKLNHLYKKAKDNAERMAVNRGENLNLAQDEIAALKKQLVARERQVMKLKEADKAQGKEIVQLKSKLQHQALPVVPECVAGAIESIPGHYSAFEAIDLIKSKVEILTEENKDWLPVYNWLCEGIENQDIFALAFITRKYEVEKPQLFYIALPKIYGLSDPIFVSEAESGIISVLTKGKDYALKLTEQEIKSLDERYWQFAVPVEVEECSQ